MNIGRFVFCAVFAAVASIAPAYAACGIGQVPAYSDIVSVKYEKTACYGVCPSFLVEFSPARLTYDGRANVTRIGIYESSQTGKFADVVALLSKFDVYSFNIKPLPVTDVPHFIVAVQRCGVTKRIDWPAMVWPGVSGKHDLRQLFDGLDRITNGVEWQKAPSPDHS